MNRRSFFTLCAAILVIIGVLGWRLSRPPEPQWYTMTVTGGVALASDLPPCRESDALFLVTSGTLPPGLCLHLDGCIRGTPTHEGVYTFQVAVIE
jgi:hypothetical protein